MAGALKPSEVKAECDRLEISPSEKDAKNADILNGTPGGDAQAGGDFSTSSFESAARGVPGYKGGYAKRHKARDI